MLIRTGITLGSSQNWTSWNPYNQPFFLSFSWKRGFNLSMFLKVLEGNSWEGGQTFSQHWKKSR